MTKSKVVTLPEFVSLANDIRKSGRTIALCHGVFDLVHPGHIQHFKAAKKLADVIVVSVTADKFVNKGPGRPLFEDSIRAETIAALQDIDFVLISYFPTAIEIIEQVKPNLYIKGSDYLNASGDVTGMILKERTAVEKNGGKIHFTNELTSSSSALINKFFSSLSGEARIWLDAFKLSHGYEESLKWIEKIKPLKVLILGETIVDQYTYCEPLAKSSKDPILAFQKRETKLYPGGILTIANNCSSWVSKVRIVSFVGKDDTTLTRVNHKINLNIQTEYIEVSDRPTILKHRFVDKSSSSRIFEYYDYDGTDLPTKSKNELVAAVGKAMTDCDLVIAADYGHGFFSPEVIAELRPGSTYLAVNTQANAGNRGYNSISKYKNIDLLSLNGAELQLELRDRNPDYLKIIPTIIHNKKSSHAILTLGGDGLLVFDKNGNFEKVPALATVIVDKVGAGDSVLAISSLLASVGAPLKVIGFLSNLVAAHEISQVGHQSSLSINDLKKHAKAILG